MTLAPIALTCGEPAGVGPELAVAAWAELGTEVPFFYIGDPSHLPYGARFVPIEHPSETQAAQKRGLPVLTLPFAAPQPAGTPVAQNAAGVIAAIERAVALCQSGAASAMTTSPIHKKALQDGAGFAYPGHTEFLAHLAGVDQVVMMLASDQLRVVPVTIHIPLADVPAALTPELLRRTIEITHSEMREKFGLSNPRLAIAGLNPHAGEGGKMGDEEIITITPVLDALRAQGMTIMGPMSADTMFHERARKTYDAAICMYHDQALIPIKTLDFDNGVNLTLGLPFIRTSPDHGTAFDIAGQGLANPSSTIAALRLGWQLAQRKHNGRD